MQVFGFDWSVCMLAIYYTGSITALPRKTNKQLLAEKSRCAKFQFAISQKLSDHCGYMQTNGESSGYS